MLAVALVAASTLFATCAVAQDQTPQVGQGTPASIVPAKRFVVSANTDFAGSDLQQIFDTSLQACRAACLDNDQCVALTFNARNNSCFPKSGVTGTTPFDGAMSARVVPVGPDLRARAETAAQSLAFLGADTLATAGTFARDLPWTRTSGTASAGDLAADADLRADNGDLAGAQASMASAAAISDAPGHWARLAAYTLAFYNQDPGPRGDLPAQALSAAINAYLRSDDVPTTADALILMADALIPMGRGRDAIPALRLAQDLRPTDAVAAQLDQAIGLYGFRITGNTVESNLASPRICADFSEPLALAGVDYTPFVRLPDPSMAVEADGNQICLTGGTHGETYAATFRQGLPARSGEVLQKDVDLRFYIPDRDPSARFPGRGYVLPRATDAALPIDTVNVAAVDLTLSRISDRTIVRAVQDSYFGRDIEAYELDDFSTKIAEQVWTGTAEVRSERNQTITSRLPMGEALAGQAPGVYTLRAAVPGSDPYDIPAATQWFVLTDLGLTTMQGTDGLTAVVRGLNDAGARADVTLSLLSNANEVLATATTDDRGLATFAPGLLRGTGGAAPAAILAQKGDDLSFLSLTGPAFDLSDRGVEGRAPSPAVDVFLATDRGAYRAGEVIHVTALSRDAEAKAIEGLPVTVILSRPDGVEYARQTSAKGQAGGHVFAFPVGPTVPRGTWRIAVKSDLDAPALASQTVLVEDFLPERLDFTLDLPDAPLPLASPQALAIEARYLFGAPAADLSASGDYALRPLDTLPGFPGYHFGLYDAQGDTTRDYVSLDPTDAEGRTATTLSFDSYAPNVAAPVELTATLRVQEGSGRPVERRITRIMTPDDPMIGIRPVADGVVPQGGEASFDLIALDAALHRTALPVHYTINRVTTRYQWYRQYGNWEWEAFTTRAPVSEGDVTLGPDPVTVSAPVDWGRYEIVVESTQTPTAAASIDVYAGWYVPADATTTPDMLDVSLTADRFAIGDTATLRLVPRYAGTALVSVLSNHLIDMKIVEVTEGENLVDLPVTEGWGAGAYVTATVLRPMDVAAGHNPARALGLDYAPVDPGAKALSVRIDAPETSNPRGPLAATVHVDGLTAGDTGYVTLAAVDLGILTLTGFETPDPQAHYFGQRRLGVELRDLYGRLIDGLQGEMGRVRSGGDATNRAAMDSPPPDQDLVAFFSGPVTVNADGTAQASFDIPAFNGTVRLMALGWSETGVGSAQSDVLVRDPVVVSASLPRTLAPGDQSRMLLEITHATGPTGVMGLSVTSDTLSLGDVPAQVTLDAQQKTTLSVPILAQQAGDNIVQIALTTPDGRTLRQSLTLPVRRNTPQVAQTRRFSLAPGATFTLNADAFDGFHIDTASATLSAGPLAQLDVPGLLAQLARYPYGCTEQVTSQAMPLLYLSSITDQMGLVPQAQVDTRLAQAVDQVLARQQANGGFNLWSDTAGGGWLDAYVTDFLSRARANGIHVPDLAFRRALDNLRNQVNYAPDFTRDENDGGEALAYQLLVLAREGEAQMGDLRYYADTKGGDFATPLAMAQIGAALATYGDTARADAMFARAGALLRADLTGPEPQTLRPDFGTHLRDAAAVLTLAAEAGSNALDRPGLISQIGGETAPRSTQESAWTLLAAKSLVSDPSVAGLSVNGAPAQGPMVRVMQGDAMQPVTVTNTGATATDLTLTTLGVPDGPVAAGGEGYGITRRYYTLDGQETDPGGLHSGDRLVTVITVTPFADTGARLMVNDPLPAGFEIDNPRLLSSGDVAAFDWLKTVTPEMSEFRSDRFLAALDWRSADPFTLAYVVRAVTPGDYLHPAASVEDMYRPRYRARTDEGRVSVTP
ncbi:alpha-2-macroglobulin family protein [Pseudooceanicola sediminis]|uniref:Alpha-2-macroglobulin family protein n=2 Tax=Pseudooceanicola sediminis TaxID=2211117 RepID=A0A399J8R4_9RHOB|nr:alpha-2-macroglobulin family protein [Puniceibacterium sp. HSS470]RII40432.1 alpha-2-macroglobulin family protein [Pseudooceanicola sediminis]|tara:strand:- start:141903 stop:147374 length:5472 start_codon:yes stop_codon:yes gene_type:complete